MFPRNCPGLVRLTKGLADLWCIDRREGPQLRADRSFTRGTTFAFASERGVGTLARGLVFCTDRFSRSRYLRRWERQVAPRFGPVFTVVGQ